MTSPDLDLLMNQEIDGQNSREDSIRLHEALGQNPAARRQFRELQQMAAMLSGMETLDPPAGLSRTILSAIRESGDVSHPTRNSFWEGVAFWRQPALLRLAYVFVAGVGLGILGSALMLGNAREPQLAGVSGTLAPDASRTSPDEIRSIPFQYDQGSGTAHVRKTTEGSSITVETSAPSGDIADLGLDFDGGQILGYRVEAGSVQRISSTGGAIRWAQGGSSQITWYLATRPTESVGVQLTVGAEGGEKFHTNFQIPSL